MNTSKAAVVASAILGKLLSIIGYCGALFFLIGIIVFLSDFDPAPFIVCVIFMIGFILLIIKGSQIKRRIKRFKRYVSLISTQHMTSLDNIAASTSQSIDFVRNDLQKMIDKKFFANASINMSTNEIIIGGMMASAPVSASAPQQAQTAIQSETEMFTCSGCGASGTKAKGVLGSCDYCGSTVK